ncbi:MAG: lysylphosphatidylglycerol synthase domain-containing protein [Solirubrobacterales bacterium]
MDAGPDLAPPARPDRHGALRRALTALLVLAAFAFLGLAVARDWGALRDYDWSLRPVRLFLSLPPLIGAFCIGVLTWHRTLLALGGQVVPFPLLLRIWFLSSLARYIPGKIWQFVGTARMAADAGLPAPLLLTSLLLSMGFNVIAAGVVGAALLPEAGFLPDHWRAPLLLVALAIAALATSPTLLNACLRLVPRALHRSVLSWQARWSTGLWLLLLAAAGWLVYGAGFWLFVGAITTAEPATFAPLTAANALAFLAGYLVVIAPAGLGARELSMAALLQPILGVGAGMAALIAIASRLWVVAGELLGAGTVLVLARRRGATPPSVLW